MKTDITTALVNEHKLILRMIALLERNAARTVAGGYSNWRFYLDGVDFIRNYADRFHHAKEEDVLFEALIKNGMPRENSPIAAMLMEHDQGRAYVRAMEAAALDALAGKEVDLNALSGNALAYAQLLREHIGKEDGILYPLAERVMADTLREGIVAGYAAAEARTDEEFSDRYLKLVQSYENEE
ncbi:MAG: hemerythrin domain-containing protein [Geobacteraceae bacterium]|nr:hemerythrin domain-containing protein [Geobacteraceae bacterium]